MSRTMFVSFPGAATAIGLVESSRSIPPQGAMWLALPTARYSPIMSCASGIAAYSDAGPAWLLRLTPTQAAPAVFAFAIAVFAAKLITTCPMPLSPSMSAIPAASRATFDATHVLRQSENSVSVRAVEVGARHQLGAGGGVFRGQADREQGIGGEALELGRRQASRGGVHCVRSGWRDMPEPYHGSEGSTTLAGRPV